MNTFIKDPDAILDFVFDWAPNTNGREGATTDWLESGETIASVTVTASSGITVVKNSITDTNTSVTVWLSGGTAGSKETVACKITTSTSPARVDERTINLLIKER